MDDGIQVLVASANGAIIAGPLANALRGRVAVATGPADLRREIASGARFDVVLADLTWTSIEVEYRFDGFDVLVMLRDAGQGAAVVMAAQGVRVEQDFVDEIPAHPEIAGLLHKSRGLGQVVSAIRIAARGRNLPAAEFPLDARTDGNDLHGYFGGGRRGSTAGRLAGAVASGRAGDANSLRTLTDLPLNTVNKLTAYLAPLIRARHEVPDALPVTSPVIYRWCGEHAHYLLSWCRRHGHADVADRFIP